MCPRFISRPSQFRPHAFETPSAKKIRDLESDENVVLPLLQRNILALHFGILVPTCVLYYHNITHLTSEYLVFDAPCPLESPLVRLVSFDIPSMLSIPHVDFPYNFLMQPSHVMLFGKELLNSFFAGPRAASLGGRQRAPGGCLYATKGWGQVQRGG